MTIRAVNIHTHSPQYRQSDAGIIAAISYHLSLIDLCLAGCQTSVELYTYSWEVGRGGCALGTINGSSRSHVVKKATSYSRCGIVAGLMTATKNLNNLSMPQRPCSASAMMYKPTQASKAFAARSMLDTGALYQSNR